MTRCQNARHAKFSKRFKGLKRISTHIKCAMKSDGEPLRGAHDLTHAREVDIAVFIQQAGDQPGEPQVAHEGDIIKHGTELARRVTKITAAWTNNRVNGNRDGLTGGLQHAVRRRQPALFGGRTQFNAVSPVILRGDGTLHAVTANLQQRHVILLKFHQMHHHDTPSVFSPGGNSHLLRLTGNDLLNGPGMKLHRDLPVRDGQRRVG